MTPLAPSPATDETSDEIAVIVLEAPPTPDVQQEVTDRIECIRAHLKDAGRLYFEANAASVTYQPYNMCTSPEELDALMDELTDEQVEVLAPIVERHLNIKL